MYKGLDLIKRQQPEIIDGFPTGNIYIGATKEELTELEKELKSSEIIKPFIKSLGLTFIFSSDKTIVIVGGDDFEYWYKCETQEEYDLLKEELL